MQVLTEDYSDPPEYVPCGLKENMYYVEDNNMSIERRQNGKLSQFWDDCGPYLSSAPSNRTIFICDETRKLKKVVYKNRRYCYKRERNKKAVFLPLKPQPESNMIIALRRYYAKYKHSPAYEKRISRTDEGLDEDRPRVACYEYRGLAPRGVNNESEKNDKPTYTRIKPTVLERIIV